MDKYDIEMIRGPGYDPNIRIHIESKEKALVEAVMDAVNQVYKLWYDGQLFKDGIIQVHVA